MNFKLKRQFRLPGYDYSRPGFYFITICTKNRERFFGKIINEKMLLSNIGEIVKKYWLELPKSFDNIYLDEYIIMPNHVHVVIEIMDSWCRPAPWRGFAVSTPWRGFVHVDGFANDSQNIPTPPTIKPLSKNSLSSIINHFKGNVKRHCNKNNLSFFEWQPKFYDRIIHDEFALFKIREYIKLNPEKWFRDRNNVEGIFM